MPEEKVESIVASAYSSGMHSRHSLTLMPFNLPNVLTWMRILAIPLFVGIFYFPPTWLSPSNQNLIATIIFTVAAITDWLDGYLARVLHQTSAFGAFLDPVADKLMVAAALIVLVYLSRLDALIAFIIIGREITISALQGMDGADRKGQESGSLIFWVS